MKLPTQEQKFLFEKREKRRLKLLSIEQKRRYAQARYASKQIVSPSQTLKILQRHIPKNIHSKKKNKFERIQIPNTFSIVDDPEGALKIIYTLVSLSCRKRPPREISFDHSALTNFDLSAEEILDVVALDFRRARQRAKGGLVLGGKLPADTTANRFIRAVGIIRNLQQTSHYLHRTESQSLKILRFTSYRALLRASEATPRDRATERLVDYFNGCLSIRGAELTPEGIHTMGLYAGEVLDNAIEHSGTQDWVLVGYLDLATHERVCEISIFNFGKSYAETFSSLPEDHYMRQRIDPFVETHRHRGFFSRGWEKENLLSVIALQGSVSSKNNKQSDTRGNGTVDLIRFFQNIYFETQPQDAQPAKMIIISGKTRILFDGQHTMQDSNGQEIIAFNSQNDLNLPPDRTHVKCLDGVAFPGTIVSIRFPFPRGVTTKRRKEEQ